MGGIFPKPVAPKNNKSKKSISTSGWSKRWQRNENSRLGTTSSEVSTTTDGGVVIFENGRTREKIVILGETFDELGVPVAPYPSGDNLVDRATVIQYLDRMLFGSLFSAPIEQMLQAGAKVLDVGSGGGQWLIQIASEYPNSVFYGLDLDPQLHVKPTPPNVNLIRGNILEGMSFDDNEFDFVHVRSMYLCFRTTDWLEKVIPEVIRVTRPGGWLELCEYDNRFSPQGPRVTSINELYHMELLTRDVDGSVILQMPNFLRDTGELVDLHHLSAVAPFAPSHGRISVLCNECLRIEWIFLEEILRFRMDINDHDTYVAIAEEFTREVQDLDSKTHWHRVYGQKVS